LALSVQDLSDKEVVVVLRRLAQTWFAADGVGAFAAFQKADRLAKEQGAALPKWLEDDTSSEELVTTSRAALLAIEQSGPGLAAPWLRDELSKLEEARGQLFDPLSLAIVGGTFIGCILAARVQQIGNVSFFKGIPPELAKIMQAFAGAASDNKG
jgi:hypothetical protein